MKIRADRAELASAVAWVSQAVSKRPSVMALGGVKIKAEGDRLALSGFDYDVSHQALVDVDVVTEGECLVSAGFLRELLGGMRGSTVELLLEEPTLAVESGRASYRVQCMPVEEYPNLPKFPAGIGSEVYVARKLGRYGVGCELKPSYWRTAVDNLRKLDADEATPSIWDDL